MLQRCLPPEADDADGRAIAVEVEHKYLVEGARSLGDVQSADIVVLVGVAEHHSIVQPQKLLEADEPIPILGRYADQPHLRISYIGYRLHGTHFRALLRRRIAGKDF